MRSTENSINTPAVLLDVSSSVIAKVAERFAISQQNLTLQQLKAWVVFVASLDSDNDAGNNNLYRFDAIELAKRMSIDERKARGTIVANLFDQLSNQKVTYRGEIDDKGEQHVFSAHLVSSVVYNKNTRILQLEIPRAIRPLLFALKQGTFMSINTKDVVALDTTFSIRVYIYLKNLERNGVFMVDIDEFRKNINATAEYLSSFKELKKTVIKPSVQEIRKHTAYKDFFIEDNGRRGVKATHLKFGFEKTVDSDIFEGVSPKRAAICRKYSRQIQIVLRRAMDYGFDPCFIADNFDDVPEERILANFRYVIIEIIHKENKHGVDKGPDVYGKYFLSAVKENWAGKADMTYAMLGRNNEVSHYEKIEKHIKEAQENENAANAAVYRHQAAKSYLDALLKNFSAADEFIKKNLTTLQAMTKRGDFDIAKALSGKKTYKEYKALVQLIEAKIMTSEIKVPSQESLFV